MCKPSTTYRLARALSKSHVLYKRQVSHNAVTQLIQTEATNEHMPEHRIKL